jgi:16S rRNA processing protein RimM
LVGCAVTTKAQEKIGIVKDVWPIGESVLLVVESSREAKEILIPFSQAICPEVDTVQKRIVIDPPDGLLDLNEI